MRKPIATLFLASALSLGTGSAYAGYALTDAQCVQRVDALYAEQHSGWSAQVDALLAPGGVCEASFTLYRRTAYTFFPDWQSHAPTNAECGAALNAMWALGDRSHYDALAVLSGPCLEAVSALPDPPK